MKMRFYPARDFLAAILTALLALHLPASGQVLIGTGDDVSYAVIEAEEFGPPLVYEYHYTHNPSQPLDGYALLSAIDSADPGLSLSFLNFGDDDVPSYFLDSVTYNSKTLATVLSANGPFWAQWVSGGVAGYNPPGPIDSGVWSFGSGISDPYRIIGPGSWDGFVYNMGDAPPSISPVPEPQSSVLLLAGITVVLWMLRRKRHEERRI